MEFLKYGFFYLLETILRFVPLPQKTGLIKIGHPDRNSPVFLTGNYHLTVLKVKRALRGMDAFLLVANSHGINVWCASAGGHLTHHEVISALKLSHIEDLVDHREVILPQLAACGIEARIVRKRTGWKVLWGPVYAHNIPAYMESGLEKTSGASEVRFPWIERLEMAVAWASWMSVVLFLILSIVKIQSLIPSIILVWTLSILIFSALPVYLPFVNPRDREKKAKIGRVRRTAFLSVLILINVMVIMTYSLLKAEFTPSFLLYWGILSTVTIFLLGSDLAGSTPHMISETREEKDFEVFVDEDMCHGTGICEEVCPRLCFSIDPGKQKALIEHPDKCICCGACIVQCPCDALLFKDREGEAILPDYVRKHRVGFSGKRKPQKK
jgi:NAD-dependent dihydropyrimidine dehydrogenase PreA subunit